jgi:Ca-activated chloride channel homolog
MCASAYLEVQAQAPAEPISTYRRTTAEVRLTFLATENRTRIVDSLQQGDFVVVDSNAVIRDFRSFARAPETKVELIILIDRSESVLPQIEGEIREVMRLVAETRWIGEDHVSIVSFAGTQPKIECAANCRAGAFQDALSYVPPGGATPLFDAVVFASAILAEKRDPDVRPVLVIFSDGADTISRHTANEAMEAALKAEAQIYAVDIAGRNGAPEGVQTLKRMSNVTGGRYLGASNGAAQVLASVLADLRSAYVVTYSVPNRMAGFHPVRILPTRNMNLEFRSRRGYYCVGNTR